MSSSADQGLGTIVFWDDNGSIICRHGEIIQSDHSAHMLQRYEIVVSVGDVSEVAQWQCYGGWLWGGYLVPSAQRLGSARELLLPYLPRKEWRRADPDGPPLKLYTHRRTAERAVVAVYSLILRGYAPARVLLFGEDQSDQGAREVFRSALPFAQVVPTGEVFERIQSTGNRALSNLARRYWFVMKTCISLFYLPEEFCLMDDDVFVLASVADALQGFGQHDPVFAPDTDHGRAYQSAWGWIRGECDHFSTGRFNAGLYWMRVVDDLRQVAAHALRVNPGRTRSFLWEQGLIAYMYAQRRTLQLPSQRYFYPLFDGLPGGLLGYNYAQNPCEFASVHFAGLAEKPDDAAMLYLIPDRLGEKNVAPAR